jgi:Phage integrase family
MSKTPETIEPSFAKAIEAIAASAELPKQTKAQWCSALRGLARCFNLPPESIPARYSAVRARMLALRSPPFDWTGKTLANIKSNAKTALLWFRREQGLGSDGMPMTPAWQKLHQRLTNRTTRYRLAPLMRFCSAVGVQPASVDEHILGRFLRHREATSTRAGDLAARRIIAKLWNDCVGTIEDWPDQTLYVPPARGRGGLSWHDLSDGWRSDVNAYLKTLTTIRRDKNGHRIPPCKLSTIITRKRELVAAAKMAVQAGVPSEALTSLGAMLRPQVVNTIIDAYWKKDGDVPTTYTINLACRFEAIARQTACLDADELAQLGDLRYAMVQHREEGMTEKNLAVIRAVLTPGVWGRFGRLPEQLMEQARNMRTSAPVRAALLAQTAVAVGIELVAPIRLGNLAAIRLAVNLIKPGGPDSNYWLQFPKFDVKNKQALQFAFTDKLTKLIDEYVFDFRPILMKGKNEDWLFPGRSTDHKEKIGFSTQIVDQVEKATGIRITVHQYRHAAAAMILKHRPGEYELVRQLLGHKSVETTKRFYLDLETTAASEIYTDILRRMVEAPQEVEKVEVPHEVQEVELPQEVRPDV